MVTVLQREAAIKKAVWFYDQAGIFLKEEERAHLEVADFGLGMFDEVGIIIHTYFSTKRVSAKEMVLLPCQICPEQVHQSCGAAEGKEESFRVRYGTLYIYTEGEPVPADQRFARLPTGKEDVFTVFHEVKLEKGDQFTIYPGVTHWIVGGPLGCVVSEFATANSDETDIYTDPAISRMDF